MNEIKWQVVNSPDQRSAILEAEPVAGIIPDGLRVLLQASSETTTVRKDGTRVQIVVRKVSLTMCNENGDRGDTEPRRFGRTLAHKACWAQLRKEERFGQMLWWAGQASATRGDRVYEGLPEGANHNFWKVMRSAAQFVEDSMPELWLGADVMEAGSKLQAAQTGLAKSKAEVERYTKELATAQAVYDGFEAVI